MINIENAQKIDGWMYDNELKFLAECAFQSKVIIEIGCYKGRSTRAMADNTDGIIYAIDAWKSPYYNNDGSVQEGIDYNVFPEFCKNLSPYIAENKVRPIMCYSKEVYWLSKGIADFVFIDGDHRYEFVSNDIQLAKNWIKSNGIIAGHDYFWPSWPGVKKAVDENFPINVNFVEQIWWVNV